MTANPIWDSERYYSEQDRKRKAWLRGNPECMVCGETIEDERCIALLDDFQIMDNCVCRNCADTLLSKMRQAQIDSVFVDWIAEELRDKDTETPHRDVG